MSEIATNDRIRSAAKLVEQRQEFRNAVHKKIAQSSRFLR